MVTTSIPITYSLNLAGATTLLLGLVLVVAACGSGGLCLIAARGLASRVKSGSDLDLLYVLWMNRRWQDHVHGISTTNIGSNLDRLRSVFLVRQKM
jgi:hypothetical protein